MEVPEDANPIDPVPVVTTPSEPEDEEPDDNPDDDSGVADDSNWGMNDDENYPGEGEGDVEEEEQDDESNLREEYDDELIIEEYAARYPFVQFGEGLSQKEMIEFYKAFATMPSAFHSMDVTVKFDSTLKEEGNCVRETVTFRDIEAMNNAIFEELFHVYQNNIKGWNLMCDTRAETEFEVKMTQAMYDYTTKGGLLSEFFAGKTSEGDNDEPINSGNNNDSLIVYLFFDACFSHADYLSDEFKNDPWQFFDENAFTAGFEEIFNLWLNSPNGYDYLPNEDYDWSYWSDWFDILRLYY